MAERYPSYKNGLMELDGWGRDEAVEEKVCLLGQWGNISDRNSPTNISDPTFRKKIRDHAHTLGSMTGMKPGSAVGDGSRRTLKGGGKSSKNVKHFGIS